MVRLPDRFDPTLAAIDQEMERRAAEEPRRSYLGASQIGEECERKLWYGQQPAIPRGDWNAQTLRRFEDGHRAEAVLIERLRLVPGIELHTQDEQGGQFGFRDYGGRFAGHVDGLIRGLLQAPGTEHVFEAKAVNEKKFAEFLKIRDAVGEKETLAKWDYTYWAQGQVYMGYFDLTRHYLVVMTPGGVRDHASCRTEFDREAFVALREKARRILAATEPPARISERSEFFKCKWCEFQGVCHGGV